LRDCIRWIAPSDFTHLEHTPKEGVMAVRSRDGQRTFASVRLEPAPADPSEGAEILGNPWLTCMHTDIPVRVPARGTRKTRQRIYVLQGDLATLRQRIEWDRSRGDFSIPQ
jgi:hypothetical protein